MRRQAVREKRKSGKSHRLNQAAKSGVAVIVDTAEAEDRDFPLFAPVSARNFRPLASWTASNISFDDA